MSAALPIIGAALLAVAAALRRRGPSGSRAPGLRLGPNDLGWCFLDLAPATREYPDVHDKYQGHLVLSQIETFERGRFFEAMRLVEAFARDNGYAGVLLRAESSDARRFSQDALEGLYRRAGYSHLSPDEVMDGYDEEDAFFVKAV
jgi:hypothetical protein